MAESHLHSQILRVAVELPVGDPTRRELLAALQRRRAGLSTLSQTILDQMGGMRAMRMIGASQLVGLSKGLGIKWPNKQRSKGNYVEILLRGDDTYDMTFYNVSLRGKKKVKEHKGVYNDQLVELFERQTGWYLRMASAKTATIEVNTKRPNGASVTIRKNVGGFTNHTFSNVNADFVTFIDKGCDNADASVAAQGVKKGTWEGGTEIHYRAGRGGIYAETTVFYVYSDGMAERFPMERGGRWDLAELLRGGFKKAGIPDR
jgi:hypothetical protein